MGANETMDRRHYQTAQTLDLVRFYYRAFCQLTRQTAQTIPNHASTHITFDTQTYHLTRPNQAPMHDTATHNDRIYIRIPGVYSISASVVWDTNNSGIRLASLCVNGSVIAADARPALDAFETHQTLTAHRKLNLGDYLTLSVFQNSGGNLQILLCACSPVLSVALLGD